MRSTLPPASHPPGHAVGDAGMPLQRLRHALDDDAAGFRTLADHAPVVIWVTDADGACTFLNAAWYRTTGQTEAQALGFGWLDATHPDDRLRSQDEFLEANAARRPFRLEYRLRQADGAYRWSIDAAAPRFDADRTFLGYVGTVMDIDERKRVEGELQRLADDLAESDRRKDEFLATLSHELRNPLAPLVNALSVLARTVPPQDAASHRALALAERQARQLGRLVDDLLEVTRIRRGSIELRREPFALADVVRDAVEARRPGIDQRRQTIEVVLPDGPLQVVADPVRIAQVLDNLLTNAKKFTPDGGKIRVECRARGRWVETCVSDSGIGIEPADLPRVFELFTQLDDGLARSSGGVGIGLALVRHLVELHGGEVAVASDGRGCGACFSVRLPRDPPAGP